jgi:IS1 family transposase
MAYNLNKDKQIAIVAALAEGNSIRSIERMTGVHRDTIMRLGVKVGETCTYLMDEKMRGLNSRRMEVDEIWGFIGKKKKNVTPDDSPECGDVWTFIAIDSDTKVIPCFYVGKRDLLCAGAFINDLAGRMKNRIQLSSDALNAYVGSVASAFGTDGVDFGQIVRTYSAPASSPAITRYSPGDVVSIERTAVYGKPVMRGISTSYIERQNATLRQHCRRLTRLTHAFSKKLLNFRAAVALNFAYFNFCLRHITLGTTPAVAAGVATDRWTVAQLVEAS